MAKYQIIYWRDIPVQIRLRSGRVRNSRKLSERMQKTVNRAAYRAKAITGDAYEEGWRSSAWQEREGELEAVAVYVAAEIERAYTDARLDALARSKGFEEEGENDD